MRKICYVSGTRADFGLMSSTLKKLHNHPKIDLTICVTAMHLSPTYGNTVTEVEKEGFRICARVSVDLDAATGASMAIALGQEIVGITKVLQQEKPDMVLLLGDRGETLAAAIAAVHLNIPIVHIHGGERSGTVDEMVRHAISKFAHYHFVATEESRKRLIKMGEWSDNVFVTGAPGLDGLTDIKMISRSQLCEQVGFDPNQKIGLLIYHPVVQEIELINQQMREVLLAALESSLQLICLTPNADAGGQQIQEVLKEFVLHKAVKIFVHMPRKDYFSWMQAADVMLGNSSSAIIEAASFNLMAVNIGTRQNIRERSENILDVPPEQSSIRSAINQALTIGKKAWTNIYGDGKAGERMVKLLLTLPLEKTLLSKSNAY